LKGDFSSVPVHGGRPAEQSPSRVNAWAAAPVVQCCTDTGNPGCTCGTGADLLRPGRHAHPSSSGAFGVGSVGTPLRPAMPNLRASQPGDPMERKAEGIARSIVAGPATRTRPTSSANGWPTTAQIAQGASPLRGLPPRARPAGLGSGRPLPITDRAPFEAHFGRDLSAVRVHTDQSAADLAGRLGARAFTVGTDIAFSAGQFRPAGPDGRLLLAHELTHVLQQTVGLEQLPAIPAMVQRACLSTLCPPASVEVSALNLVWRQAEICIQEIYEATHPASRRGISLGFNLEWTHLRGSTAAEKEALHCLRGNFTAKSGMFAGEPDIWDFKNTTMYEITTLSGAPFRVGKLAAEIALANQLTAPAECGGIFFSPGTWIPPGPCYAIGGDLYISVNNDNGVLVYQVMRDITKELALAALLATMAAAAKSGLFAGGKKLAGRAVPAYAVASLVAGVVLLASGKARAQFGPGTEEPIAQLFKAMADSGTPVPPEVQEMIESDPGLKAKIEKAITKGGDPSAAQQELNNEIMAILAANKDQFSAADLEVLLATTGTAQGRLPQGKQTVETIRKMLDEKRTGAGGGKGKGGGKAADPKAPEAAPKEPAAKTQPTEPPTGAEPRAQLAAASAPVRKLWDAIVGTGPGPAVTDENTRRFLAEVPSDLTDEQVNKLITLLGPVGNATFDEVLAQLKQAVSNLRKPADAPDKKGDASTESAAMEAGTGEPSGADNPQLIKELAAVAAKIGPKSYRRGQLQLSWTDEKDDVIEGTLRGRSRDGRPVAASVKLRIHKRTEGGKNLHVSYLASSPLVDDKGQIVETASERMKKHDVFTIITQPK
jgi:Domain of unknown function (DUF4157)